MFRASLDEAITHLAKRRDTLCHEDFRAVHRTLFEGIYPWAGQDRTVRAPDIAVTKAGTWFSHPAAAPRAVQEGLRIGSNKAQMRRRPGEVMGLFAHGHPFLDGHGRTMPVVHTELCHRAGFCIEWHRTNKPDYLTELSAEIATPGKGILDACLPPFAGESRDRPAWGWPSQAEAGCEVERPFPAAADTRPRGMNDRLQAEAVAPESSHSNAAVAFTAHAETQGRGST
jgi:cell filamentation protein